MTVPSSSRARLSNTQDTSISAVVEQSTQATGQCFPLLSLPQLPLAAVVKCLQKQDRHSLAAVCRSCAAAVSSASGKSSLLVRHYTGWEGLRKIFEVGAIKCKSMWLIGPAKADAYRPGLGFGLPPDDRSAACSRPGVAALDVLLEQGSALECSFPGVQKLFIRAYPLPSILPTGLASLLPDLTELHIECDPSQYADDAELQPISYCSGVRRILCYLENTPQLPSKYHTSEDLRKQLPNVDSLEFIKERLYAKQVLDEEKTTSFINTMLNAWCGQLTKVVLDTDLAPAQLQQCTRLQTLRRRRDVKMKFAEFLPQSLTSLELDSYITEPQLEAILQLPLLRKLEVFGLDGGLQHDWSNHPCSWQQLRVREMPMVHLSKLPLHSLAGEGCLQIHKLELPDPLLPDSLSKVQRASENVSNAGIVLGSFLHWPLVLYNIMEELRCKADPVLADMLSAAGRVVRPRTTYGSMHESHVTQHHHHYPRATTALLRWLSPALRELSMYKLSELSMLQPWFWKALQCCDNLKEVLLPFRSTGDVTNVVLQACAYLVTVTGRPVKLAFQTGSSASPEKDASAAKLKQELQEAMPNNVVIDECVWGKSWGSFDTLFMRLRPRNVEPAAMPSD